MNKKLMIYIIIICTLGLSILLYSFGFITINNIGGLLFWMILASLCQSFVVVVNQSQAVTVTFAVILAVQLTYGTFYTVIVTAFSVVFYISKEKSQGYKHVFNTPLHKTLFNLSNHVISMFLSGKLFDFLNGMGKAPLSLPRLLFHLFLYVTSVYFINSFIIAILISQLQNQPFSSIFKRSLLWAAPNFYVISILGYFLYELFHLSFGYLYVLLLFGPLLLARHSFILYVDSKDQYYRTLKTLTAAIEARDEYTEGHSRRVEMYSELITRAMNLSVGQAEAIKVAALLHDIGKIGIEDSILRKPSSLTKYEWEVIREHPKIGVNILGDAKLSNTTISCIKHHHERYDGKGYPDGLKGSEIPIETSILSIADAYDAMTSDRPYRGALSKHQAIQIIKQNSGSQFEPKVAQVFTSILQGNQAL